MKFKTATRLVVMVAALTLVAGFALGPAGAAFADPAEGGNASCMGYESWANPPGSDDSEPLGMQSVLALVDASQDAFGATNRGGVISVLGHWHLGGHDEENPNDCP